MFDDAGSLKNAAIVASHLHRGEKRLVLVDSRARAEKLGAALRGHDVTTFVSHGSLGQGERRAAETAFSEARDCVIVATSTLELGIDVGDLDRVIQIDSPPTVAAFLQRLGRSGRRNDTRRYACFSPRARTRCCAQFNLAALERDRSTIIPPPIPLHPAAQQLMALASKTAAWGNTPGRDGLASRSCLVRRPKSYCRRSPLTSSPRGYLDDQGGVLGIGVAAEAGSGTDTSSISFQSSLASRAVSQAWSR
jgi:ATP-dependent Lhr-like helicase